MPSQRVPPALHERFDEEAPREEAETAPSASSPCYTEASALLERLRVLLGAARKSPDYATHLAETIQTAAARQRRAAYAMWSSLESLTSDSALALQREPLPPPAFSFTPMATAPSTTLWFPPHASQLWSDTQAQRSNGSLPLHEPKSRPSWNASTLPPSVSAREGDPTFRRLRDGTTSADGSLPRNSRLEKRESHHTQSEHAGRSAANVGNRVSSSYGRDTQEHERVLSRARGPKPAAGRTGALPSPAPAVNRVQRSRLSLEDVERERAVRDYLRRMNILGRDGGDDGAGSTDRFPFHDALFNGAALCQVAECAQRCASGPVSSDAVVVHDPVPRRRPRTLEEVHLNYTAALSVLSGFGSSSIPAALFRLTPEGVYVHGRPTVLLDLYFHLITHYFPPLDSLSGSQGTSLAFADHGFFCWQPPADDACFQADVATRDGAALMQASERQACQLLFANGVLPDPRTYSLPGDDCIVPGPLSAPYVIAAQHTDPSIDSAADSAVIVPRLEAPAALYVPSVFPFLTNGTALCSLARRLYSTPLRTPFPHPKTHGNCRKNIVAALDAIAQATRSSFPASISEDILSGNRRSIVAVLDTVSAFLRDTAAPTNATRRTATLVEHATPSGTKSADGRTAGHKQCSTQPPPLVQQNSSLPPTEAIFGLKTRESLRTWFLSVLGTNYRYTAEDGSFSVVAQSFHWTDPCLVFSDGVVLAQCIRTLECSRCDELECVRPTSKRAAKRFNVRRCLDFLRQEKSAVMPAPLLDDLLMSGDLVGVLQLLRTLRGCYRVPQ